MTESEVVNAKFRGCRSKIVLSTRGGDVLMVICDFRNYGHSQPHESPRMMTVLGGSEGRRGQGVETEWRYLGLSFVKANWSFQNDRAT